MPHSYSNIWTHLVLWTKGHAPLITSEMAGSIKKVLEELPLDFYEKQTHLSVLPNHIHLLIKLPGNHSVDELARFVQQLICKKLLQEGFENCPEWDEDYYAHSVSLNRLSTEKSLLDRQEYKHKEISLEEELKFLGL
jgi:putative transposase